MIEEKNNRVLLPHSVCLIGAGNVATHIAKQLVSCGHHLRGVYSFHKENAAQLLNALHIEDTVITDSILSLPQAEIYILSIKDDALEHAVSELATQPSRHKALFVHTAGSIPIDVFTTYGLEGAVMYPLQTFSKERTLNFREIPLFVEGNTPQALKRVTELAQGLSDNVAALSSEERSKIHLAAVFANNFANHCFTLAYKYLQQARISPEYLLPLIEETVRKIHTMSPVEAQTGPAQRWDDKVIHRQHDALNGDKVLQHVYDVMSQSIRHTRLEYQNNK